MIGPTIRARDLRRLGHLGTELRTPEQYGIAERAYLRGYNRGVRTGRSEVRLAVRRVLSGINESVSINVALDRVRRVLDGRR